MSAVAVASLHAGIGYVLLMPSIVEVRPPDAALTIFEVPEVLPEPPVENRRPEKRAAKPEAAASAANRHARPGPVVAPPPEVRVEVPPPVVAAPVAASGVDASAGASDILGPGTGSDGAGSGMGSGYGGDGTGGGGTGARARWIKGHIRDSDYPRAASAAEVGGTVIVHFEVGVDGRASNCRVASSSGNADLDATTCRLVEKRFRYEPAINARGEPVPDVAGWKQAWWLEPRD